MQIENQERQAIFSARHSTVRRVALALGSILLLLLGLRFLNFVAIYSFPVSDNSAKVLGNQIIAMVLFGACQLGGGGLLRMLFRRPIPEIDTNESALDRCFSVLRWSLLFFALSGFTVFLVLLYGRGTHTH